MSGNGPALEVERLRVHLGQERVLDDVTFRIREAEFVGIAGPNGGGKSTLLRAVLGLTPAQEGEVRIFGTPCERFRDHHRVGYVPQYAAHVDVDFPATAREVVALGLLADRRAGGLFRAFGLGGRARAVEEAMRAVGVEGLARRRIGQLSGGERQRVLLAKALVTRPDLLILDEPTTGVDPKARDNFAHLLIDLNRQRGMTIVLVSHDTDILHHAAQRLLVIDRGLRGDGPPDPVASTLHSLHHHGPEPVRGPGGKGARP